MMGKSQPRECRFGCGTMIYFDFDDRKSNGKPKPIEVGTEEEHVCPNINRKKDDFIGNDIINLEKKESSLY